jgi:hypothetical protein
MSRRRGTAAKQPKTTRSAKLGEMVATIEVGAGLGSQEGMGQADTACHFLAHHP